MSKQEGGSSAREVGPKAAKAMSALWALAARAVAFFCAPAAHGQLPCRYEYTTWPNLNCGYGSFPGTPVAVNVLGHVAGRWASCGEGVNMTFLWTGGSNLTLFPIPPGYRAMAPAAMNDLDEIVGYLELPMGTPNPDRAFLRRANGQVIVLAMPPGAGMSYATAINNNSEITGYYSIPGVGTRVFVWRDGATTTLELPSGADWESHEIDDKGRVAVWPLWSQGALWSKGQLTPLGLLPGGTWSDPRSIAPNGDVCGTANVPDANSSTGMSRRAFLHRNGRNFNLGVLPGCEESFAIGNNDSAIVGYCSDTNPPGDASGSFVFTNGEMRRLDQMQPILDLLLDGQAHISSNGLIAAAGRIGSAWVGVLLTPVTAPVGDVTNDCQVNVSDVLAVINSWGPCHSTLACPADLNGDDVVNHLDLLIVIQNWGQQP